MGQVPLLVKAISSGYDVALVWKENL